MKMRATYYNKDKRKYGEISYESKYLLDPKYMTKKDLQHYYRYYNMNRGDKRFKKIIIILCCICFFVYIFVDYNLRTKIIRLRDRFDFTARVDADYNVTTQAYFVDTPGCRMPYFDAIDNNTIQFMVTPRDYKCEKALTRTDDTVGARLWLNMNAKELQKHYNVSQFESVKCHYREIKRKNDEENEYLQKIPFKLTPNTPLNIDPDMEFISVECYDTESQRTFYKDFHFFVLDKSVRHEHQHNNANATLTSTGSGLGSPSSKVPFAFERVSFPHKHATTTATNETVERLSVMILGIDSVSHLNFLRQMPETAKFIQRQLSHVEFWGFNKVGDNTYPNLVPLLSGLDETELNLTCLAPVKQANYDMCPFIWRRYKNAGFQTSYAEDVSTIGLFNYFRPGFKQQPTDYYLRTIMMEMEQQISYLKYANVELCKGGRRTIDVIFELIRKLLPYLQAQDFFSFFWTVSVTHDLFNMPKLLDKDVHRVLELFQRSNIFNKTVVFLMSDHGLRWGSFRATYQGMMEERQPLLIALYPKWLEHKYPQAIANLQLNSKRLTTFYDVHSTLVDLLDLRNLQTINIEKRASELDDKDTIMPRGISLFLPVPETRTCETAGIASHWCTCHQRQDMPTNDNRVQRAARYVVKLINDRLKERPQCRTLYLNSIIQANIAAPHHKIVRNVTTDYSIDITMRFQTKPGLGQFESTVRMSSYATSLTGTISRINLYGSQSYCIDDYQLKMFCYCHR